MVNIISRNTLLEVVAEWLENEEFPSIVPRDIHNIRIEKLPRILAIVGPRRAGKTYFMHQLIQLLLQGKRYLKDDILFIDFEDFRLTGLNSQYIDEIFSVFYQLTGKYPRFLFFDEIQNLPDWSRVLRTLHNRRRFKIIISGSNSKLLSCEVATELRGRYDDILMLPFSFREYLRYQQISFTSATLHTPAKGKILAAFDSYIRSGGFPEVVMAGTQMERRKLLQTYYRTIFYRDILERYNIKARYLLDAMMNEFLETYSGIFSVTKFEKVIKSNGISGSKRTIANYLQYLHEAFFIIINEKFSFSPRKRMMNPKKIYLTDIGFTSIGRSFTENQGRILENIVAIELFRRNIEMYYYKDKKECDFIIKDGTKIKNAIQVCWELTERNRKREVSGLVEACKVLGLTSGIIMTYNQEQQLIDNGIKISVLPVWKWLLFDGIPEIKDWL